MDNPLKRKNEAAADAGGDGARSAPAGSDTVAQERGRTAAKLVGRASRRSAKSPDEGAGPAERPAGPPAEQPAAEHTAQAPKPAAASDPSGSGPSGGAGETSASASGASGESGGAARKSAAGGGGSSGHSGGAGEESAAGSRPSGGAVEKSTAAGVPAQAPRGGSAALRPAAGGADTEEQGAVLFSEEEARRLKERWRDAQSDFVDDPRRAVGSADELVDEVLRTLNEKLAAHKRSLEDRWSDRSEADTEALRRTMRGYRAFFRQLLRPED
ncbi:hypothetical protein FZ103_11115 [Streptomonospora sp. PA3]|uniref:hypothetical protein n=1 Tax=Streptomonospora sp. PA3 TaxID=2607326 RepID=UPI0012DD3C0E|nr:hypothetical protein [Streptomonospora sp. PA3]MUL41716.1 hypothetical protein [Streptomonospora sp. PA3]